MMSVPPDCISSSTWSTLPRNVLPWVPWVSIISRGFTPEKALPSLTITMDMLTWFQCLDFFWLLQFLSTYPTFWVNCWDKLICCRKTQFRSYHPSLIWFLEDRAQKIHQNSLVESWNHGTAEPTSSTRGLSQFADRPVGHRFAAASPSQTLEEQENHDVYKDFC